MSHSDDKDFGLRAPYIQKILELEATINQLQAVIKNSWQPPELPNEDLIAILGRPNFTCIQIAEILRKKGQQIEHRSEDEQAAVLLFLLRHYIKSPDDWSHIASSELKSILSEHTPNLNKTKD